MISIKRALISVSEKRGIVEFASRLNGLGVEILSTGGTARLLRENKIPVIEVSDYTGFPEMLDGRVKTLHPMVHGGLLGVRDNPEHVRMMEAHGIKNIDLLVVNLYQFEKTVAREGVTLEDAIENIDIGGPAMLRSSAKNFKDVTVLVDPADYGSIREELKGNGGSIGEETRRRLASKAFHHTGFYDAAISNYFDALLTPEGEIQDEVLGAARKVREFSRPR